MSDAPKKPARGNLAAAKEAAKAAGVTAVAVVGQGGKPLGASAGEHKPEAAPSVEAAPAAESAPAPAASAEAQAAPAAGGALKAARGNIAKAMEAAKAAGVTAVAVVGQGGRPLGSAPAASAAVAKPAEHKPAAATPAVAPTVVKPVEHKPAVAAKAEVKPAAKMPAAPMPKLTPRPAPKPGATRRDFNVALAVGWSSFAFAVFVGLQESLRFLYPNLLPEKPQKFKAGRPDEFTAGVDGRFKENQGVWLIRTEEEIYALSVICTHLGCIPNWLESDQKFKCPCHGSGFYKSGINFEGPAPRPMERFAIYISDDGQIEVDKTRKFQQELGQWDVSLNPQVSIQLA